MTPSLPTMPVLTNPVSTTSQSEIDLIVHGNHWNPFAVLGIHELATDAAAPKTWVVRAFLPEATSAWVVDLTQGEPGDAVPDGANPPRWFFRMPVSPAGKADSPIVSGWRTARDIRGNSSILICFGPVLTDFDLHLLGEGTHYRNYERLGAHHPNP